MKKYLISILMLAGCAPSWAFTLDDLKNQVIDQTKLTITKSGGPGGFYDASLGEDPSIKMGVLSHVLTNRFITADLGWYSSDNKNAVLVGGPSIIVNEAVKTLSPDIASIISTFVPQILEPLSLGAFGGWATDNGAFHYGVSLIYNFGK